MKLENVIMNYMVMMKEITNLKLWVNNIKDPNDVNYLLFLARYAISTLLNNPTQLITLLNKIESNHIKPADNHRHNKYNDNNFLSKFITKIKNTFTPCEILKDAYDHFNNTLKDAGIYF